MKIRLFKPFVAFTMAGALILGSGVANATTLTEYGSRGFEVVSEDVTDAELIDQASEAILEGFKILDSAIKEEADGKYYLDEQVLEQYSVSPGEIEDAHLFVRYMNAIKDESKPLYRERSWISFGLCVVGGFTGVQVNEIREYVNWKTFGGFVKEKNWGQALNILKSGVRRYMVKHGAKAAGRVALKQIINASGVGFAAQAGVAAIGCAALEGWRWFWK